MIDIIDFYIYHYNDYIDIYRRYDHTYLTSYNIIIDIIISLFIIIIVYTIL